MLSEQQQMVRKFMEEVCLNTSMPDKPTLPDLDTIRLCVKLIREEQGELEEHLWFSLNCDHANYDAGTIGNLANMADGMSDLIYVVLYLANRLGIDLEPHFNEVQRSNMTKLGGAFNKDGKLLKPPSYEPPQLISIIKEQLNAE